MKLLLVLVAFCLANEIQATDHLLALYDRNVQLALESGNWNCVKNDQRSCSTPIGYDVTTTYTNASFHCPGRYTCSFAATEVNVRVVLHDNLPLMRLSGSLVKQLLQLQYHYLTLSHRYLSHYRYLPNTSKYFKGLMNTAAETADTVAKYVQAKYVTTRENDGANPPNYIKELFEAGFAQDLEYSPLEPTNDLQQGFQQALNMENRVITALTDIAILAEDFPDEELEEFVVADLMPPILKRMKELSNHLSTVKGITRHQNQQSKRLGEFLYDRELS